MTIQNDVKEELSQMEARLTEMEEKIDAIDKKLNQVIEAILGNPLTKSGGFIKDIDILEENPFAETAVETSIIINELSRYVTK